MLRQIIFLTAVLSTSFSLTANAATVEVPEASRIFVSLDPDQNNATPSWEVAKEIAMRLPVGGALTTKAYQEIYTRQYNRAVILGLNSNQRTGPYIIKSKSLPDAELHITEIFPSKSVDDLMLAYLDAKRKFGRMAIGQKPRVNVLILHAGLNDQCELVENKLDCPFEGQFHQFMRRLPPGQIDIIIRPGLSPIVAKLKNSLYLEVPQSGETAYDLAIDNTQQISARLITLCKFVSAHSTHCNSKTSGQSNIGPAIYLGQSVQRQINTLLSSQTALSPGLQKPAAESL